MAIFVCDWQCKFLLMFLFVTEKKSFGEKFWSAPRSTKTLYVLVNPKSHLPKLGSAPFFRNVAGVVYITNLDLYLAYHYITETGTLPILER
jgi:hypothetical protein